MINEKKKTIFNYRKVIFQKLGSANEIIILNQATGEKINKWIAFQGYTTPRM